MKKIFLIILIVAISYNCFAQKEIIGFWKGHIEIMGNQLIIKTQFFEENSSIAGKLDIPQQMAIGLALSNFNFNKDTVSFELFLNQTNIARFTGQFSSDSIIGYFNQSGVKGNFYLARTEKEEEGTLFLSSDYNEEEVTFYNEKVKIAGTLSYPKGKGPFPAVILISGSGQQDRDEDIAGFKVFALISNYLSNTGFAVLRYDDRGIGGSDTGDIENATTRTFADDAYAAFQYLKKRKEINPGKIGFLGHSEGAAIGTMLAAEHKEVAFLILMSGPGIIGEQVILSQLEAIIRASGSTEEEISNTLETQRAVMQAVKTGTGWEEIKEIILNDLKKSIDELPEETRKQLNMSESELAKRADMQIKAAQTKWYKYFIQYDPAKDLEKIKCPVLAMFGEKDLQVVPDPNKKAVENALKKGGNDNFQIELFKDANHLFQKANTGLMDEYALLDKNFVDGFLEYIIAWLQKNTK